jgi:hypothetical protein
MAATVIDTTAIAAIVIGLGSTVAAMVYPIKYPSAPKWAVNLSWWGGLFSVFLGVFYLIWENNGALIGAAGAGLDWLFGCLGAIQRLPGFWIAVAFVAGLAVHRWFPLLWKKSREKVQPSSPRVTRWFAPPEAVARFVAPDLNAADQSAQEKVEQLKQKIQEFKDDPDQLVALAAAKKELENAVYVAKHRRTDVVGSLLITLKMGLLIGKGYPMKQKKGVWMKDEVMIHIPAIFWKATIEGADILNLETAVAVGYLGSYDDVVIGKNEDHKVTAANMSSGPVISHPF